MRATFLVLALVAAAAGATLPTTRTDGERCPHRRAIVVRAGAPFAIGEGRGDAAFHVGCWKIAAGWESARRDKPHAQLAIAIARTCS